MNLKFYKESNGDWFVDLPQWEGDKEELQMVAGADEMLDVLAQGENEFHAYIAYDTYEKLNDTPKVTLEKREINDPDISGCFYRPTFLTPISLDLVWLCDVTKFLFGYFPDEIRIY